MRRVSRERGFGGCLCVSWGDTSIECRRTGGNLRYEPLIRWVGKATRGYDPSKDIEWLRFEIVRWIQGNLMEKWYAQQVGEGLGGRWLTAVVGAR